MPKRRLRDRAAAFFGMRNVNRMAYVLLGSGKCAFVGAERLWIYEELPSGRRDAFVAKLTDKRRVELIDALTDGLLSDVANAGLELNDERMGYVVAQIDRVTWDELAPFRTSVACDESRHAREEG